MTMNTPDPDTGRTVEPSTSRAGRRNSARKRRRHLITVVTAAVSAVAIITTAAVLLTSPHPPAAAAAAAPAGALTTTLPSYKPLPPTAIASLPEARYDAVIPGLIPVSSKDLGTRFSTATLTGTTPLFGPAAKIPVARLNPIDFTGHPTAVSVARTQGDWALILTPARNQQPSHTGGHAAAQTAAWIPTRYLTGTTPATATITINTAALTLTITRTGQAPVSFPIGVGKNTTPTPTGATGYLQARYTDPTQGTGTTPIQLTSLHTTSSDNPAGGTSGGLIAIHTFATTTGKTSHGCIRAPKAAINLINQLPEGTPIVTR